MSDRLDPDRDEDFLAADYALGTLDAADRRRAERRMRLDDAFAREVDGWQRRLSPLAEIVEPQFAGAHVWQMIEAELPVPATVPAAHLPARSASARRQVSAFWQWLAIGSSGLAAASLAALLFLAPAPLETGPTMTAALASEDGTPLYAAVIDPGTGHATLLPLVVSSDGEHSHELWLIGADGVPASLGLLDPGAPMAISLRNDMRGPSMSGTLAVSVEPQGGSPTGQPTGPVVATGPLRSI